MYKRILVPTDGSEALGETLDEVIALARLTGATVHTLYVVDTRHYNTLPPTDWDETELIETGKHTLAIVEKRVQDAAATIDVQTAITRGVPHTEILDYTQDHDINLIVMRTHGRSGFNHFLKGSITEKVIRQTPVPILVIRIPDDA